MTEADLRALLPFLYNHRVKGQNDVRIDALSRMFLAVGDLVCVTSLHNYALRHKIICRIDALYRDLERSSVEGLCRMYRLIKESALVAYGEKDEECSGLYYELIGSYLQNPDSGQEQNVLKCIAYELGNVLDDNTKLDYYSFYRAKSEQWVGELDTEGCWSGLSQEKAVRRLESLQNYYYTFRDDSFNNAVFRAYNYYTERLILPVNLTAEQLPLFGAWYDLLRNPGMFSCAYDLQRRIAGLMEDFANTVEFCSDTWYFAISYAVVQCCTDLVGRVQHEMMQEAG